MIIEKLLQEYKNRRIRELNINPNTERTEGHL